MEFIKLEGVTLQIVENSNCANCEFLRQGESQFPCRACLKEKSNTLSNCSLKINI